MHTPDENTPEHEFRCHECAGDAFVAADDWTHNGHPVMGQDERLCLSCALNRITAAAVPAAH